MATAKFGQFNIPLLNKDTTSQWKKDLMAVQSTYKAPAVTTPQVGMTPVTPLAPKPLVAPVATQTTPIAQTPPVAGTTPPTAVSGATMPPPIPTPTKDINLNIPSTVSSDIIAGAPTSGQVLQKAKSRSDQFQEYLTQRETQRQALIQAQTPSAQVVALRGQMTKLNADARQAIATAEQSGETQRFAGGESARVSRQATIQMQGLSDQLNALVDSQKVQIDAITSQMEFDKDTFTALTNLQKMTKGDVIQTKVATNGDVYSTVQDADGNITTVKTGNIPPGAEDASLKWNEVKNSKGGTSIWAVGSDGKIVTKEIPGTGEGGAPLAGTPQAELAQAQTQSKISEIDTLKTAKGLNKAVGATFLGRWTPFKADVMTGEKANFIAGVEQMASSLSLDTLINAKKQGATFGALSDAELRMLSSSASKIGTWRKLDDEGNVVGYTTSEKAFKNELDKISNFSKLDYVLKGGDPASVGVQQTPDGKLWAINSDGTLTQLR